MALVIELKPGEKILIGDAVITNDKQRARLHIAGNSPILREKDVLQEQDADTPCKKIYFLVQCMYLAGSSGAYQSKYFELIREIQTASPTCAIFFMQISDNIMDENFYKALKISKELIAHEEELLDRARNAANSSANSASSSQSTSK